VLLMYFPGGLIQIAYSIRDAVRIPDCRNVSPFRFLAVSSTRAPTAS